MAERKAPDLESVEVDVSETFESDREIDSETDAGSTDDGAETGAAESAEPVLRVRRTRRSGRGRRASGRLSDRVRARCGRIAVAVREMFSPSHVKSQMTSKSFRAGGYTVAVCLGVIVVGCAALGLIEALPASATSIDISESGTTTVSDETKDYLAELEDDITIYLVAEEGEEDDYLTMLLASYESASSHVTVEQRDPVLYPAFTSQYTSDDLSDNSLILVSGEDSEVVPYDDLYTANYSTYTYDFAGESAITRAIVSLTSDDLPTVYALSGHGDVTLPSTVTDSAESSNIAVEELNLLSESAVPEDAAAVVLYAPESDLSEEESDRLLSYLEGGGSFLLITDYSTYSTDGMSNLASVMDSYGLRSVDGIVVEGSAGMSMAGYPYYLLPSVESTEATSEVSSSGMYVLFPLAHGIETIDNYRSSLVIEPLLSTSDEAYVKTSPDTAETLELEDGDVAGSTMVGAAVTESVDGGETHVVWYSSTMFLDSQVDARVGGANSDVLIESITWLTGAEGTTVSIEAKSTGTTMLTMDASSATLLSAFFIGAVPIVLLLLGFSIWRERRRRS